MKIKLLPLFLFFLAIFNSAQAGLVYHLLEVPHESGAIELQIIYENPAFRKKQNIISQNVANKVFFGPDQKAELEKYKADFRAGLIDPRSLFAPILSFAKSDQPLWVATKDEWSEADEVDYSDWIVTHADTNFTQDSGLMTDCADVGLLLRWVYAREKRLPIANTLSGSGKLFGHFSSNPDWDKLPTNSDWKKDERFKAALRYLFDNTFTHTIDLDQSPTVISPDFVRPGSLYMEVHDTSGHTRTVMKLIAHQGIQFIYGVPGGSINFETNILGPVSSPEEGGFKRWRWVHLVGEGANKTWELIPASEMPGFSLEQYSPNETTISLYSKLGIPVTDWETLLTYSTLFGSGIIGRLYSTVDALYPCHIKVCDPKSPEYDQYSTPSRDARLIQYQQALLDLISKLGTDNYYVKKILEGYVTEVIPHTQLTYGDLLNQPGKLQSLKSDPRLSFEERWGLSQSDLSVSAYSSSYVVSVLISNRIYLVDKGIKYCFPQGRNTCQANDPKAEALNTIEFDRGFKLLFTDFQMKMSNPLLNPDVVSQVNKDYTNGFFQMGINCDGQWGCNNQQLLTFPNGTSRVDHWTSNSFDSLIKRWGY